MNPSHLITLIVLTMLAVVGFLLWKRSSQEKSAINVGEGFWPGQKTYFSDFAGNGRYLLAKIGSSAQNVALAGAADKPIGVMTDDVAAIGDPVEVELFGSAKETKQMVASAAIAVGDFLMPAANGQVQTLSVSAGTYYVVGRALKAATAAGDLIEVDPIPCVKWVV